MKQNLLNKLWLRVGMIVAIMTTALSGTAWAETSTVTASKVTSSSVSWTGSASETWSVTVTGGATNQNMNNGYAQVGTSSNPSTSIEFSTSGISGTITSIEVNCAAYQGKATISTTVGGAAFGTQSQSVPSWSSNNGGNVTFNGSASGTIVITMTNGSGGRAMYIKSITVTYSSGGTPTPTTYTVTYNANGGTGTMTDANSPYSSGATVTVLDNAFIRDGYDFVKWNTAANGSGNSYDEGDTFTISANTTLYAQWTEQVGESGKATLTQSNLELTGSYTTGTEKTINGITYVYTDLMKNSDNIQAKASTGTIKNTTAYPGDITSVVITHSGTARATTINGSADGENWTEVATGSGSVTADFAGKGYKYFQITRGSNAAYWAKVEITYSTSSTPSCAMPTFTPAEGTYTSAQNVAISTETTGATIYYTTDGTTPTTSSNVYSSPISVSSTTTIKAIAVADGYDNSAVASATYTIVPLEHAGTEADPYTVADARTAIDANTGITSVYATGIVSAIVTAYDSGYKNITFDFIDEGGSNTLRAYRCEGTEAADVQVGDVVVVSGNLTKYNTIYEFAQGCQLVSLIRSEEPSIELAATISAMPTGSVDDLPISYSNFVVSSASDFSIQFYDAEGNAITTPDWIDAEVQADGDGYFVHYAISVNTDAARTAYFKVYSGTTYSNLVTITQTASTIANLPFEYDGNGTAPLPAGLTPTGLGTYSSSPAIKFDDTGDELVLVFNARPGKLTFDIKGNPSNGVWAGTFKVQTSTDGTTYTDLKTYTDLTSTVQSESFENITASVRYIKWVYTEKGSGNVALGNIKLTKYSTEPSISVDDIEIACDATSGSTPFTINNPAADGILSVPNDGNWPTWIDSVTFPSETSILTVHCSANTGTEARSATITLVYTYNSGTETVTKDVTITQAGYVAPIEGDKYVKVTSTADLTDGQYLIVYEEGSVAFDGGLETLDAASNTIGVVLNNREIAATSATTDAEFTIDVTAGTIQSASGYYIGQTSDNNGLASSDETAYANSISIDGDGNATVVASGGAYLRYNATSGQTRFRYFKSTTYTGQKAIQLYKKVVAPTSQTVKVSSAGYATFVAEDNLEIPSGVEVYAVTVNDAASSAHLEAITGGVPAGEAVLVKASAGDYEFPFTDETVAAISDNDLKASDGSITGGTGIYVLANKTNGVGFYPVAASVTIPAGKAYLEVTSGSAPVKGFYGFDLDDDPTAIEMVNGQSSMINDIYNLAGQRMSKMQKGINIVNGKKIAIK